MGPSLPLISFLPMNYLFQESMESKKVSFAHQGSFAGIPTTQEMQYTTPMTRSKAKKLAVRAKVNAVVEGKNLQVFPIRREFTMNLLIAQVIQVLLW